MRLLFIYNPFSGNNRGAKCISQIKKLLTEKSLAFDLHTTDYPLHGLEIVRDADFKEYDGIAVAGGDGTLFNVINGYFQNASSQRIPLGIIPIGTGNAFARELGLKHSCMENAIDIINLNKPKKIDLGQFKTQDKIYYFHNILGLGFVTDVIKIANKLKFFGNMAYSLGVFFKVVILKNYRAKIVIDGKIIERESALIEISNTRYTSNYLMAPNAMIDDGLLDVTLFNDLSRRNLLYGFPKMVKGGHIYLEGVESFKAKHISISTDSPMTLSPDGELVGITPVEIKCIHQCIDIFWTQ